MVMMGLSVHSPSPASLFYSFPLFTQNPVDILSFLSQGLVGNKVTEIDQ